MATMCKAIAMPDPHIAARQLKEKLHAPLWALSVAVWTENNQTTLRVRIDPKYNLTVEPPREFQGFRVTTERRAPGKALAK